jgi:putative cell wall-binding protein
MIQGARRGPVRCSKTRVVAMSLLLALASSSAVFAVPAATSAPGLSNIQAAIAWSKFTFADGTAPTALLARDDDFADTLTSGSVQGALNAPLLLTNNTKLSPETAAEFKRLGAKRVIVLGGARSVSPGVENEVKTLKLQTERVGGATPVETAVAVAAKFFPNATTALIAPVSSKAAANDPTRAFAHSLAAGAFAAQKNMPILLTDSDKLSVPTKRYLEGASPRGSKLQKFLIAGSEAAVSKAVADALASLKAPGAGKGKKVKVSRIGGPNHFATAVAFDKELGYADAKAAPRIILLEGRAGNAWANGLPSAARAVRGAAMVLTNGEVLPPESTTFLNGGSKTPLICGPGVSRKTCNSAGKLLGLTP